jgi:hypothetical protein
VRGGAQTGVECGRRPAWCDGGRTGDGFVNGRRSILQRIKDDLTSHLITSRVRDVPAPL